MCKTEEINSSVCLHRTQHTSRCRWEHEEDTDENRLNGRVCIPSINITYTYELCRSCSLFWGDRMISEHEAEEATMSYRKIHNNHSPLPPHLVWQAQREYNISVGRHIGSENRGSTETLWPSIPDRPEEDESLPLLLPRTYVPPVNPETSSPHDMALGGSFEGFDGDWSSDRANTQYFVLGDVNKPLPALPREDIKERPVIAMQPDLNKPLPRPPRPDTPHPGAPRDSQYPDRDLPANQYYPRFI